MMVNATPLKLGKQTDLHSKIGGLLALRHRYSLQLSSLHLHSNMRTVFPVREIEYLTNAPRD